MRIEPDLPDARASTKSSMPSPGGQIMVRYFYAWTPLLIVGTLCILALPWLGLIALIVVALVALPALALAIVIVPYLLSQALIRLWHQRGNAIRRTAPALHVFGPQLGRSTDSTSRAPGAAFQKRAVS